MMRRKEGGCFRVLGLAWFSCASFLGLLAGGLQQHSASFELGPGEIVSGLQFPPYRAIGTGSSLRAVEVELESYWTLHLTVPGPKAGGSVPYALSNAVVSLDSQELATSFRMPLALSGEATVTSGSAWEGELQASGRQRIVLDSASVLSRFSGESTPTFQIEFMARHPERISSTPEGLGLRFCDSRISGRMMITYRDEAPAPVARDDHLGVVLGPTVAFEVQRLLSNDTLGPHAMADPQVDPWTVGGFPVGREGDLVVCNASPDFAGPDSFAYSFRLEDGSRTGARVLFTIVTPPEPSDVLPAFRDYGDGLLVEISWTKSRWVVVERADGGLLGPWNPIGTFPADPWDRVAFLDWGTLDSGARFYRLNER